MHRRLLAKQSCLHPHPAHWRQVSRAAPTQPHPSHPPRPSPLPILALPTVSEITHKPLLGHPSAHLDWLHFQIQPLEARRTPIGHVIDIHEDCSHSLTTCQVSPVKSSQVRSGQARPRPGQARSGQVRPGQARSGRVRPGQAGSGRARSGQAGSGQVRPGQARSGRVRPGQARSSQVYVGTRQ